jgi:hypothetical protein
MLEMQGLAVHRLVWMASVLYFFANVHVMGAVLESVKTHSSKADAADSETKKSK